MFRHLVESLLESVATSTNLFINRRMNDFHHPLHADLFGVEEGSSYEVITVRFLQQYVVPSRKVTSVGIPTSHSSFYVLRVRPHDTFVPT